MVYLGSGHSITSPDLWECGWLGATHYLCWVILYQSILSYIKILNSLQEVLDRIDEMLDQGIEMKKIINVLFRVDKDELDLAAEVLNNIGTDRLRNKILIQECI